MPSLLEVRKSIMRMAREPWREIRMAQIAPNPGWYRVDDAFEMWIDPDDETLESIVLSNYRQDHVDIIRRWVKPGDTCFDCGAHHGYIAHHLARQVGKIGRVFAFEPDETVHGMLQRNCTRNAFDQVWIYPSLLGEEEGSMQFYRSSRSGWSTMFPNEDTRHTVLSSSEMPVHSLDDLRATGQLRIDLASLSFVKISCMGAEPFIIAGMGNILSESDPLLSISVNERSLRTAGSSPEALQRALSAAGYVFFRAIEHKFPSVTIVLKREMNLPPSRREYHIIATRPQRIDELESCGIRIRP